MEDLFGIQTRRQAVQENIEKAFGSGVNLNEEIEKARSGIYADTAENRKLNRVGQQYGKKKEEEQPKEKVSTKKEDEPSDKKGASEKQDMSSHAAKASDGALKRAAADEKAPEDVRNAAKEELKKRDNSEFEQLKNKLFNEQSADVYNEVMFKLRDEKDKLSGKIAVDDKYGEYDSREYLRILYDFKNAPNSRLKSIISERSKSNKPFDVADKKAAIEILEKRKAGDKMFQPEKKENKDEKLLNTTQIGTHNFVRALKTNEEGIEGDFVPSKECLQALKRYRSAAFNFIKKNPDASKLSDEEIQELLNPDNYEDNVDKYNGFENFYNAAEDYYNWSEEFDGDEDDISERIDKKAEKMSDDAISAIVSDQGGLRDDDASKKQLNKIKKEVINFVKNNPDVSISISGWEDILNGDGKKKFGHYEGFDKLDKVIDNYLG